MFPVSQCLTYRPVEQTTGCVPTTRTVFLLTNVVMLSRTVMMAQTNTTAVSICIIENIQALWLNDISFSYSEYVFILCSQWRAILKT